MSLLGFDAVGRLAVGQVPATKYPMALTAASRLMGLIGSSLPGASAPLGAASSVAMSSKGGSSHFAYLGAFMSGLITPTAMPDTSVSISAASSSRLTAAGHAFVSVSISATSMAKQLTLAPVIATAVLVGKVIDPLMAGASASLKVGLFVKSAASGAMKGHMMAMTKVKARLVMMTTASALSRATAVISAKTTAGISTRARSTAKAPLAALSQVRLTSTIGHEVSLGIFARALGFIRGSAKSSGVVRLDAASTGTMRTSARATPHWKMMARVTAGLRSGANSTVVGRFSAVSRSMLEAGAAPGGAVSISAATKIASGARAKITPVAKMIVIAGQSFSMITARGRLFIPSVRTVIVTAYRRVVQPNPQSLD